MRKIIITGASGGIGLATARRFAQNGDALFLQGFSNGKPLEELRMEFSRVPIAFELCDFSQVECVKEFAEHAWNWIPPEGKAGADVLFQAAGVDILTGKMKTRPFGEKLRALWNVDVVAGMELARDFANRMDVRFQNVNNESETRYGVIVNVSWNAVEFGMSGDSAELFAAAKGAMAAFSRCLAQRWAPRVHVHCVAPGWIQTEWGEMAPPAWQERARAESLCDRWGTPRDIAEAVFFLASPAASFLNDLTLPVDGGCRR